MGLARAFLRGFMGGLGVLTALGASALVAITVSGNVNTFVSGDLISAAMINENFASLRNAIEGLPDCSENTVILSTTQSIADNTFTVATFAGEEYDSNSMHDTTGDTERITIQQAGRYLVTASASFGHHMDRFRALWILKNASGIAHVTSPANRDLGHPTSINATGIYNLVAGDYLRIQVLQDSGMALNTNFRFSATRLCGD